MGGSFSTMMRFFFAKRDIRIAMVGLDAAGKTTCLNKLKLGETLSTIPTIGFNVDSVEYKNLKLTIWDIGGQQKLRSLWKHYYQNCDAVVYVVDSADKTRIGEAQQELHAALADDNLRNATVLIFANKQDMPTAMSVSEVQDKLKLREIKQKWFVQGCVATTGNGLWEGLDWLSANLPKASAK
jgi:ADP-ribosylation factor protein 1